MYIYIMFTQKTSLPSISLPSIDYWQSDKTTYLVYDKFFHDNQMIFNSVPQKSVARSINKACTDLIGNKSVLTQLHLCINVTIDWLISYEFAEEYIYPYMNNDDSTDNKQLDKQLDNMKTTIYSVSNKSFVQGLYHYIASKYKTKPSMTIHMLDANEEVTKEINGKVWRKPKFYSYETNLKLCKKLHLTNYFVYCCNLLPRNKSELFLNFYMGVCCNAQLIFIRVPPKALWGTSMIDLTILISGMFYEVYMHSYSYEVPEATYIIACRKKNDLSTVIHMRLQEYILSTDPHKHLFNKDYFDLYDITLTEKIVGQSNNITDQSNKIVETPLAQTEHKNLYSTQSEELDNDLNSDSTSEFSDVPTVVDLITSLNKIKNTKFNNDYTKEEINKQFLDKMTSTTFIPVIKPITL